MFHVVDYKLQFELASQTTIREFPGVGQGFGVGLTDIFQMRVAVNF